MGYSFFGSLSLYFDVAVVFHHGTAIAVEYTVVFPGAVPVGSAHASLASEAALSSWTCGKTILVANSTGCCHGSEMGWVSREPHNFSGSNIAHLAHLCGVPPLSRPPVGWERRFFPMRIHCSILRFLRVGGFPGGGFSRVDFGGPAISRQSNRICADLPMAINSKPHR